MRLYNTLTKRVEAFGPREDQTVGMYVCGPTVYDHLHIGNVRPVIVFSALRRYMERFKGWQVSYVQNVTDVDDKLIRRSGETGETVDAIARTYTNAYFSLLDGLGVDHPSVSPRATEHIAEMVDFIVLLIERGAAYERSGSVYFRVEKVDDYGALSGRRLEDQEAGSRVDVSEEKDNPLDFTLWKAAKPGEPSWPSPWGTGRPGWHTECVVMSRKYLGQHLDIHAGGNDLVFPHHENEIAQAKASSDAPFFRFWLHNGMLHMGGEEMHKSLGNFRYAHEILTEYGPETVGYFYLSRHYRKPLDYSQDGLEAAQAAVARVRRLIDDVGSELRSAAGEVGPRGCQFSASLAEFRSRYVAAMDDDFNTVDAMAAIHDLVSETNRFRAEAIGGDRLALRDAVSLLHELGAPMGLFQEPRAEGSSIEAGLIELLISLRRDLRARKAFDLSDRVRDQLTELGVELKDTAHGTLWSRRAR
jgi:cysteinyl-tRNA synthetase